MKPEEIQDNSRRDFLKITALATATVACGSLACSCNKKGAGVQDEKAKLLTQDGRLVEIDSAHLNIHGHKAQMAQINARQGIPGRKFVMVIDLGKCKNARKCISGCQKMHHLPEDKEWVTVKLMRDNDKSAPYWLPKVCFHCDNPPCVKVCPVNATFKRTDGLVLIDNDRCIGCKFCMTACPYSTRVFNWDEPYEKDFEDVEYLPESSLPSKVGTVEKCDFCADAARENMLPDCVTACPNGVFYFGDENEDSVTNGDEVVRLSDLLRDKSGYRYAEELGTEPRVWYLPPRDRQFPVERGYENMPDSIKNRYKDVMENIHKP